MTNYKRILVTGATGVLGSAFRSIQAHYPAHEFVFSSSRDCDLRNPDGALDHVKDIAPDCLMHLAAVSGGIGLSMDSPATVLRDNVLLTINVLESARIAGVKKTVMALSSGMYPSAAPLPFSEECIHDGPAHSSNYGYSYAKRLIEPAIRAYRKEY